jgi:hypothetical protein
MKKEENSEENKEDSKKEGSGKIELKESGIEEILKKNLKEKTNQESFNVSVREINISDAPVLEQIAEVPKQRFWLEQNVGSEPIKKSFENEEDIFKYQANAEENPERKYVQSSGISSPERIAVETLGRKRESSLQNEINFMQQSNPEIESPTFESYVAPEKTDVENAGRERTSFFESKKIERKYDIK